MRVLAVLIPVFVAGLAGFFTATGERGGDDRFAAQQRHPIPVRPADVEAAVRDAPGPDGEKGERARCRAGGGGDLRNPWACTIAYPSGLVAEYAVTIRADGSYTGDHRGGSGSIAGCCVALPE